MPGAVSMTMDVRNARDETLLAMVDDLREAAERIAGECRVAIDIREVLHFAASRFDASLIDSVRNAATALGLSNRDIVSGAAHDAVYISRVAPTAMIFVPCEGGLSHNEMENATREDLAAGADVLLNVMAQAAGSNSSASMSESSDTPG